MASRAVLAAAAVLTAMAYGLVLVVTGFVACGISGCSGGGFGPAFAPRQAQAGLAVAGLVLLPLAWRVLRGRTLGRRAAACAAAVAGGAVLAMVLLGLGPHGCPWEQTRATTGTGAATCSSDVRR